MALREAAGRTAGGSVGLCSAGLSRRGDLMGPMASSAERQSVGHATSSAPATSATMSKTQPQGISVTAMEVFNYARNPILGTTSQRCVRELKLNGSKFPTTMRVLCLHSFRTNAAIMAKQMEIANYGGIPDVEFEVMDGIHVCETTDPTLLNFFPPEQYGPGREWWNAQKPAADGSVTYDRFDETIEAVARRLRTGTFDGIMGFSQGGAVAAAVLAMQVHGALPTTLKFGWIQGAFVPQHKPARKYFQNLNSSVDLLVSTYDKDPFVPARATRQLVSVFPSTTYVELEGKAHKLAKIDDTSDAAKAILAFFEKHQCT